MRAPARPKAQAMRVKRRLETYAMFGGFDYQKRSFNDATHLVHA